MMELDLTRLTDRELLIHLATVQAEIRSDVSQIETHQRETNDNVTKVTATQLRQEGAIGLVKWVVGGGGLGLGALALAVAAHLVGG